MIWMMKARGQYPNSKLGRSRGTKRALLASAERKLEDVLTIRDAPHRIPSSCPRIQFRSGVQNLPQKTLFFKHQRKEAPPEDGASLTEDT